MPDVFIEHPPGYDVERRYIHDVILGEFLGLSFEARLVPGDTVRISSPLGPGAVVLPDRLFQTPPAHWLTSAALPHTPLPRAKLPSRSAVDTLPIIYGDSGPLHSRTDDGITLPVDVFGSAFFMLTRYEEALPMAPRDRLGRFPDQAALAIREGFAQRPVVNEYVELLSGALRTLWPWLPRPQRRFRAWLTHDVDWPLATFGRRWPHVAYHVARDAFVRRVPEHALLRVRSFRATRTGDESADMWNTFDFIMSSAEQAGLRASFYLIPERLAGKLDGSCSIDHPFIRRLIRQIDARGHELGLHTSFRANGDSGVIARQLAKLRSVLAEEGIKQEIRGGRQHYLRWLNPDTWQGWDDAGLAYDSSLGWERYTGFRAGTCYEYPAFNLRTREPLALRERPLTVMEEAAFIENNYHLDDAAQGIVRLIRTVRKYNGDFVLLWHNNWLAHASERRCFGTVIDELTSGMAERCHSAGMQSA